ncbi:LacI family DNA-binding transcriptional regulator [Streptomyces cavernicola]|uniref:LacI family DNA-binding transcriptional regulator n=1 Tax=Streptomyces cavernicola TaxID=3043613 RepID=A0ABT6SM26_9ACTN|nr:LacI family DNA-binding transcriptional regulator [Streptomyces sp. B-S-A6]MDI3409242.1 LacI family DNA-binding transcriptional regulator [Streptomyces sp. B-S-A6]
MTKLEDVAEEAGVSASTVSRALSRPDMVSEATRTRVLDAAERLGYRHNQAARALVTGRTGLLAFSVPSLANPYYAPVIAGAQAAAEEAGCELIVVVTDGSAEREQALYARLSERVDGFAAAAPVSAGTQLSQVARKRPLVTLNRRVRGVSSVVVDTPAGMGALGGHLAGLGHRRIAYLGGPDGSWLDPRRLSALREAVPDCEVAALGPYPPEFEAGVRAADAVLDTGCTAVIAYSSTLLIGLLHRLTLLGKSAPHDLSLACADDLSASGLAMPEVTALHVPAAEAGRRAVQRLLETVTSGPTAATHQLLPVELLTRASTGRPAA